MVRPLSGSFCVAATLLLATAIGANAQAPTAQIDRVLFVPLGGLEQWISIRGEDRSNPVLLVVHGGPGEAQWPAADIFKPWEKAFTVVQWDQRGTGHTYGHHGEKTPDVTLDRIFKDGVELAAYLCRELHKDKIIVLGHSWGSLVAVHMVQLRPELFAAYVGTGQVSSWAANVNTQFDLHLAKARREGDEAQIKKLEAIGRPDPTNTKQYFSLGSLISIMAPSDQAWIWATFSLSVTSRSVRGRVVGYTEIDAVLSQHSGLPVSYQTEDSYQLALHFATRREPYLAGSCRMARIALPPAELAAAIVLQRQGTIVIMEACKLFSRRRVATTACAVLPAPGIVG